MSRFERGAIVLFLAASLFWGVTIARGDESGFGLVLAGGLLVVAAFGWRLRRH